MRNIFRLLLVLAIVLSVGLIAMAGPSVQEPVPVLGLGLENVVPNEYVVVYNDNVDLVAKSAIAETVEGFEGQVLYTYSVALNGVSVRISAAGLEQLRLNSNIKYIEAVQMFHIVGDQSPATWGIDRSDQRDLPLSNSYHWDYDGSSVHAYILDTGIRKSHTDFEGRAYHSYNALGSGDINDDQGHGTHVAGTVGSATYGIAKKVKLYAIKICDSGGSCPSNAILSGVDWVTNNHQSPAVANMSISGGASSSMDDAIRNSINAGVVYAVAAGNNSSNACNYSPARIDEALTAGSTTSSDARSSFSNYGTCVDVFAPGSSITSTSNSCDTCTTSKSGTSMASPHVCGVAALVRDAHPGYSPAQVFDAVINGATEGRLSNIGTGSPNLLLYSLLEVGPTPTPTPTSAPTDTPTPGPTPTPTNTPEPGEEIFCDDFETDKGWTTDPDGTDTATTGTWERANPEGTSYGGLTYQLGTTVNNGSYDLVTGPLAGSSIGSYDIDNGDTTIRSPNIELPTGEDITLSFYYYLAHYNNASSADYLRVKVVGATTTTVFEELGAGDYDEAAWATFNCSLNAFAGQTIYLLVEAADASGASLVEAAIDDLCITLGGPVTPTPTPTGEPPTPTPVPPTPTPTPGGGW